MRKEELELLKKLLTEAEVNEDIVEDNPLADKAEEAEEEIEAKKEDEKEDKEENKDDENKKEEENSKDVETQITEALNNIFSIFNSEKESEINEPKLDNEDILKGEIKKTETEDVNLDTEDLYKDQEEEKDEVSLLEDISYFFEENDIELNEENIDILYEAALLEDEELLEWLEENDFEPSMENIEILKEVMIYNKDNIENYKKYQKDMRNNQAKVVGSHFSSRFNQIKSNINTRKKYDKAKDEINVNKLKSLANNKSQSKQFSKKGSNIDSLGFSDEVKNNIKNAKTRWGRRKLIRRELDSQTKKAASDAIKNLKKLKSNERNAAANAAKEVRDNARKNRDDYVADSQKQSREVFDKYKNATALTEWLRENNFEISDENISLLEDISYLFNENDITITEENVNILSEAFLLEDEELLEWLNENELILDEGLMFRLRNWFRKRKVNSALRKKSRAEGKYIDKDGNKKTTNYRNIKLDKKAKDMDALAKYNERIDKAQKDYADDPDKLNAELKSAEREYKQTKMKNKFEAKQLKRRVKHNVEDDEDKRKGKGISESTNIIYNWLDENDYEPSFENVEIILEMVDEVSEILSEETSNILNENVEFENNEILNLVLETQEFLDEMNTLYEFKLAYQENPEIIDLLEDDLSEAKVGAEVLKDLVGDGAAEAAKEAAARKAAGEARKAAVEAARKAAAAGSTAAAGAGAAAGEVIKKMPSKASQWIKDNVKKIADKFVERTPEGKWALGAGLAKSVGGFIKNEWPVMAAGLGVTGIALAIKKIVKAIRRNKKVKEYLDKGAKAKIIDRKGEEKVLGKDDISKSKYKDEKKDLKTQYKGDVRKIESDDSKSDFDKYQEIEKLSRKYDDDKANLKANYKHNKKEVKRGIAKAFNLKEATDFELMQWLNENDYEPSFENVEVLREYLAEEIQNDTLYCHDMEKVDSDELKDVDLDNNDIYNDYFEKEDTTELSDVNLDNKDIYTKYSELENKDEVESVVVKENKLSKWEEEGYGSYSDYLLDHPEGEDDNDEYIKNINRENETAIEQGNIQKLRKRPGEKKSKNFKESYSDYELMQWLNENDYEPSFENVEILKEYLSETEEYDVDADIESAEFNGNEEKFEKYDDKVKEKDSENKPEATKSEDDEEKKEELKETVNYTSLKEACLLDENYFLVESYSIQTPEQKQNKLIEQVAILTARESMDPLYDELLKTSVYAQRLQEALIEKYQDVAEQKAQNIINRK